MSPGQPAEGFWDFSVRTYRTPDVPEACLSLQNDYGADVNMVLYCCWIGGHTGQFDDELFAKASAFSSNWAEHVVVPLRSARTWMKHTGCSAESVPTESCMELREDIKRVEFGAEKLQQDVLASLVSEGGARDASPGRMLAGVIANLNRYADFAGYKACDDISRKYSIIIHAAFPAWNLPDIKRSLAI